jgi:hypothetical protein
MMRGKKGQIPILMLFLVAIILVITALFSFFGFEQNFGNGSLLVSQAIAGVEFGQDYVNLVAKDAANKAISSPNDDLVVNFKSFVNSGDRGVQEAGNFFKEIKDDKFDFKLDGVEYKLEVKGLFVQSSYGNNEIRRNYDLCLVFGLDGNYLRKC